MGDFCFSLQLWRRVNNLLPRTQVTTEKEALREGTDAKRGWNSALCRQHETFCARLCVLLAKAGTLQVVAPGVASARNLPKEHGARYELSTVNLVLAYEEILRKHYLISTY